MILSCSPTMLRTLVKSPRGPTCFRPCSGLFLGLSPTTHCSSTSKYTGCPMLGCACSLSYNLADDSCQARTCESVGHCLRCFSRRGSPFPRDPSISRSVRFGAEHMTKILAPDMVDRRQTSMVTKMMGTTRSFTL